MTSIELEPARAGGTPDYDPGKIVSSPAKAGAQARKRRKFRVNEDDELNLVAAK